MKSSTRWRAPDGSHYDFSYSTWGQVWKISFIADNQLLNYRSYKLPQTDEPGNAYSDCPRFTERRDWAKYWNGDVDGTVAVNEEAVTTFTAPVGDAWTMTDGTQQTGVRAQVTLPDGTANKIYFIGTAGTSSGWRRGLPLLIDTVSGGVIQRRLVTTWTQDNTSVSYPLNPRVTEKNIHDPANNRARTQISYQQFTFANGTSCWLPRDVFEYVANASTVLRTTRTNYNTSTSYTDRRILGLPSEKMLYEGDVNGGGTLMSKLEFVYDEGGSIQGTDAPVQHDNANYSASFVTGRANLSKVKRYNVNNLSAFTSTSSKYNSAGAVVSSKDALNHEVQISYADSFSDGNNSRKTLAYPTTVTDPDGYTSTSKYNFDFGAMTYKRTPQPNVTTNTPGPEQTFTFDSIGRLQQITNLVNSAYTRFIYAADQTRVDSYATIQAGLGEAHSFQITDGAGRVIANAKDHPGTVGGFGGQRMVYDVMGRIIKTSNPTETSASGTPFQWNPAGDDASAGWIYTEQTYDWKGRPLVTTKPSITGNPADTTTKTVSYSGCGCAGGEVVTLTDEGTIDGGTPKRRQQKIYSDVLGRRVKTEILNWEGGSVYSATVNSYNVRDQVMEVKQYAGAEGSSTFQTTTMAYDGYGRLSSRHVPEQDTGTATVWTYNADDTINTITDARGAVTTFGYTGGNRHLVKSVTHTLTGSSPINVSYTYDAVGNRTSMTDGLGSATYTYNDLSQLTSETRNFTAVGSFTNNYAYNLAGQLTSVTDPFGAQFGYTRDVIGRVTAVTGSNFASISTYASNVQYRAWGALKSLTYGNSKTMALTYDPRLNVSTYEMPGVMKKSYQYYNDDRLKFTQDQLTTNSKFDRLYRYDHTGRATVALSGLEARGGGPTDDRPYKETMTYDALGHLTSRDVRQWDRHDVSLDTYTNNRRDSWQYDADGRLLSGSNMFSYDAAGQITSFGFGDPHSTDQQFDGDGRRARTVLKTYDIDTGQLVSEEVTYLVHSTVLGSVLSEVGATGAKERSFVFAGGQVVAIQTVSGGTQSISWEHYDGSGASYRPTDATGNVGFGAERDPFGANAGLFKPFSWPIPTGPGKIEPYYGIPELNSTTQGCIADGIPIPCDMAFSLVFSGAARITRIDPLLATTGRGRPVWVPEDTSWGAVDLDAQVVNIYSGSGGYFVWVEEPTTPVGGEPGGNQKKGKTAPHVVNEEMFKSALAHCINKLYPMFEMISYQATKTPLSQANDDQFNGVVNIKGQNGSSFPVVSDPTPPGWATTLMVRVNSRGLTAKFGAPMGNPFWTFTCPSCDSSKEPRPAEKRYPELFGSLSEHVRVQLHELGAALTNIRDKYYPPPAPLLQYPKLDDGGLYPQGHPDDGPAMEDCVGSRYYNHAGLTPRK